MAEEDGLPWGRSHHFFANMGGFVLDFDNSIRALTGGFEVVCEEVGKGFGIGGWREKWGEEKRERGGRERERGEYVGGGGVK